MTFRIGQKVVRVGAMPTYEHAWAKRIKFSYPAVGEIVTIKTINNWPTGAILTFYEHDNSALAGNVSQIEPGFGAKHFRPIVERKTDISVFTQILRKASKKAP